MRTTGESTMKEYIIWGVKPNKNHTEVLEDRAKTMEQAQKLCDILEKKYGCTNTRVQVLDLTQCPSKLWTNKNLTNI